MSDVSYAALITLQIIQLEAIRREIRKQKAAAEAAVTRPPAEPREAPPTLEKCLVDLKDSKGSE